MKKVRRILVIDGSRVVRATLTKHLKGEFDILEESDGESAWQTLMLDADITAVISGIYTPKLEAYDLLARLRASSMRRLHEIPFVLIVSDVDNQVQRDFETARGVAGFITKTMSKTAIVACLTRVLTPPPEASAQKPERPPMSLPAPLLARLLESDKFKIVLTALSCADPKAEKVCALVFGIDNRDVLIDRFGEDIAGMIAERFASLLVAKVSPRDLIGRCRGERLAIISYGVDLKEGVRFGKRVCKSLASGQITIRGQKVNLTASVGVASTSDDEVKTGGDLFLLADQRLDQALVCGGNTVATEFKPDCPMHFCRDRSVFKLIDALNEGGEVDAPAHIGTLGLKILPLIRVMNDELQLGLPLADIQQQLELRASIEDVTY